MKKVWMCEKQYTDRYGVKFGIVYLNSKLEKPLLYLDGPYEQYGTPAITLLSGKMYRLTLAYDSRQSENFQVEWLVQELRQKERGRVEVKNTQAGVGWKKMPPEFEESFRNAFKLATSTGKYPKPWNLGQPTRLEPLFKSKPKRGKLTTIRGGESKKKKEPWKIDKSGLAKQFGFKVKTTS
jgi:hypothetical protein